MSLNDVKKFSLLGELYLIEKAGESLYIIFMSCADDV